MRKKQGKAAIKPGDRFGRLTAIERVGGKSGEGRWLCRCDCGNERTDKGSDLLKGKIKSCGCLRKEYFKTKERGQMETKKLNVKLGEKDAERVAHCMEAIAGDISADDIIEIVLRSEPEKVNPDATMTSKELANVGRRQHAAEFKRITRFLCTDATDDQKKEFLLDSFTTQNGGKEYPMYRMTEKGCSIYFDLFKDKMIYRSVQEAVKNMREAFLKKFHPEEIQETLDGAGESEFLFENKPKETYKEYSEIFNMFLDSTAYNGREIAELTDEYSAFIRAMDEIRLSAQENNKMLFAMHDVAMKAEKQGFIYGLKLADTLLSNRVQKAAFA